MLYARCPPSRSHPARMRRSQTPGVLLPVLSVDWVWSLDQQRTPQIVTHSWLFLLSVSLLANSLVTHRHLPLCLFLLFCHCSITSYSHSVILYRSQSAIHWLTVPLHPLHQYLNQ